MSAKSLHSVNVELDCDYLTMESLIRTFVDEVTTRKLPLFRTAATNLSTLYLTNLPLESRQHYNCRDCLKFIDDYGGLVAINEDGVHVPVLWRPSLAPPFFSQAVDALCHRVSGAQVTGVFINGEREWGRRETGEWTHLSGTPRIVHDSYLKTSFQVEAEKKQDYILLKKALEEFHVKVVEDAVRVLKADLLAKGSGALDTAEWFLKLHEKVRDSFGPHKKNNHVWMAAATAPAGWCHIRNTMIGTLLTDLLNGYPFEVVSRRWAEKMHPLQYRRPTKEVTEGQVERANKLVEQMGLTASLARRFARLSDIPDTEKLWEPPTIRERLEAEKPPTGGKPFDHLRPRGSKHETNYKPMELPAQVMSWKKFLSSVLAAGKVYKIEAMINGLLQPFYGLVTAEDDAAPPILQWDREPNRNRFSWYFYHGGSLPSQWNIDSGWREVTMVMPSPVNWYMREGNYNEMILFALYGAQETGKGVPFFPQMLRNELHEVRSVMEAYAKKEEVSGKAEGDANGIALIRTEGDKVGFELHLRVNGKEVYRIERWE